MQIQSIVHRKNKALSLYCICFILLILFFLGCGEDYSSTNYDNDTGSYVCSIKWPEDVPTLETTSNVSRAIDCSATGISVVRFSFYNESDSFLTGNGFSCSLHVGTVSGIQAGNNIWLVVTGEDSAGNVLYRGERTDISIVADQTTHGEEILMARVWTMLKLPDTGQTQSYTSTFGEDSDYIINPPSYTDNGDGAVTDNVTSLMWQKEDDNTIRTWYDAITCCNDFTLAGYYDWRLPSAYELMSIVNCDTYNPAIDTTYFPGTNASYYWSSTTCAFSSSSAWLVGFSYGAVYFGGYKSSSSYVRCVRAGQ